jgi:hypothetical protein
VVYCHLLQLILGGFVRHGIGPIKCGNWCCVDGEPRGYERPWDSLRHTAPAGESLIAAYAAATIEVHKLNCWQCYKNLISNCLIKGSFALHLHLQTIHDISNDSIQTYIIDSPR